MIELNDESWVQRLILFDVWIPTRTGPQLIDMSNYFLREKSEHLQITRVST